MHHTVPAKTHITTVTTPVYTTHLIRYLFREHIKDCKNIILVFTHFLQSPLLTTPLAMFSLSMKVCCPWAKICLIIRFRREPSFLLVSNINYIQSFVLKKTFSLNSDLEELDDDLLKLNHIYINIYIYLTRTIFVPLSEITWNTFSHNFISEEFVICIRDITRFVLFLSRRMWATEQWFPVYRPLSDGGRSMQGCTIAGNLYVSGDQFRVKISNKTGSFFYPWSRENGLNQWEESISHCLKLFSRDLSYSMEKGSIFHISFRPHPIYTIVYFYVKSIVAWFNKLTDLPVEYRKTRGGISQLIQFKQR